MNKIFTLILTLTTGFNCLFAHEHEYHHDSGYGYKEKHEYIHPKEIQISENKFTLSTYFDIDSATHGHLGNVVKEKLSLWSNYKYYGNRGSDDLLANAYIRLMSFGQLFTWASVMDVQDAHGNYLGTIEGCILTLAPSKFVFKNASGQEIGVAYMDNNHMGFTVICSKDNRTLAKYTRIFVPEVTDYWFLDIYEHDQIPLSFLVLFGAFAVDHQGHFRADH